GGGRWFPRWRGRCVGQVCPERRGGGVSRVEKVFVREGRARGKLELYAGEVAQRRRRRRAASEATPRREGRVRGGAGCQRGSSVGQAAVALHTRAPQGQGLGGHRRHQQPASKPGTVGDRLDDLHRQRYPKLLPERRGSAGGVRGADRPKRQAPEATVRLGGALDGARQGGRERRGGGRGVYEEHARG
ncbi:unnamed protein product, partial [Ectocarpus sp. 13 AM-2016]